MADRWLGLLGPHQRKDVSSGPYRKRGFWQRPTVIALRTAGWAGAIACAIGLMQITFHEVVAPDANASMEMGAYALSPVAPTDENIHLLAATMWGEARSEGEDGMRAVAHVMVNRVGPRFGESLETVILAPKQFSVWNLGDPNRPLVRNPERYAKGKEDAATWAAAQRIAREVLTGQSADPTSGSLFYHTRAINPRWARYGVGTRTIGAHIFYRDVPNVRAGVTTVSAEGAETLLATADRPARVAAPPAQRTGPRAGRVNGVIQHAPVQDDAPPPVEVVDTSRPVTPPELEAAITL